MSSGLYISDTLPGQIDENPSILLRYVQSGNTASFNIYFALVRFPYFFDNFK